jgi:alpha-tubulin suppressor-like RCC1 family protein
MVPSRGRIVSLACVLAMTVIRAPGATAQTGVRVWGDHTYDVRVPDDTFVEIVAGGEFGIARRSDGTVVAWGDTYFKIPTLPAGVSVVQIAAGYGTAALLTNEGSIVPLGAVSEAPTLPRGLVYTQVAAGADFLAALRSDGEVVVWDCYPDICEIPRLPPGTTYVQLTAGFEHLAALRSDGVVVAWGGNHFHQCDVTPPEAGLEYRAVYGGAGATVALRSDGRIVTWGEITPVPDLPRGLTYVDVRLGSSGWHAFARRSDGVWVGWGYPPLSTIPDPPGGLSYVDITSSWDNSWALRSDGTIFVWGSSDYGQLDSPAARPDGVTYTQVSAGTDSTLTLRSDGAITAIPPGSTNPPTGHDFVAIAAGNAHYLALRKDGTIAAWGNNQHGQCDVPPLPPNTAYVEISAGSYYSVARRSDGNVVAWGTNQFGQCNVPRLPTGLAYTAIDAGGDFIGSAVHTVALRSDGSAVAWGNNVVLQCDIPPLPPGLAYVQVSAGAYHTLLVRSDGVLVAVGGNSYGQCNVPPLPPGVTYVQASGGWEHSAALRSDGTIVAFGRDNAEQCEVPPLPAGLRFLDVSAGHSRTVARYAGCATCYAPFCLGDDGGRSVRCPCANYGELGRGCDNSAATGGAMLAAAGSADPDRVVLTSTHEIPNALSIFVQGRAVRSSPAAFGDGAICIGDGFLRLGSKTAAAGTAIYPATGDASIRRRSSLQGDPILPGTFRYYQVFYLDPSSTFCRPSSRFNASNAVMIAW